MLSASSMIHKPQKLRNEHLGQTNYNYDVYKKRPAAPAYPPYVSTQVRHTQPEPTKELVNLFDSDKLCNEHDEQLMAELQAQIKEATGSLDDQLDYGQAMSLEPEEKDLAQEKSWSVPADQTYHFDQSSVQPQQTTSLSKTVPQVFVPSRLSNSQASYHYQSIQEKNLQKQIEYQQTLKNRQIDNTKVYSQVFADTHAQIKLLHPKRPILITDHGFQIKIQDLNQIDSRSTCPENQEQAVIYLQMPFNNQIIRIQSINLTSNGQFIMCVVKTSEQTYVSANYHLVIFDLDTCKLCSNQVLPGLDQVWDHPNRDEIGKVVKVIEAQPSNGQDGTTRIWTVHTKQVPAGGITMLLWLFNFYSFELTLVDQRTLENSGQCQQLQISPFQNPKFMEIFSSASHTQNFQAPEVFKFVTIHKPTQQTKIGFTSETNFLTFWSYSFKDHDLFLDKSIQFNCRIALIKGCSLTKNLYIQRADALREVLIFDGNHELVDKIDQADDIMDITTYQDDVLILITRDSVIYYHLKSKKQLRVIALANAFTSVQLFKQDVANELLMGFNADGSGLIFNLDTEQVAYYFEPRRSTRTVHTQWLNQKQMIKLLDDPVPILQKYQIVNSQMTKIEEKPLEMLRETSCFEIDQMNRYIFIGTKSGVVQVFNTSDFEPASEVFTFSTYQINNIETYCFGNAIYIIIALSSGQVSLYKQTDAHIQITQNHRREHFTIQRQPASTQLNFEFIAQIQNHFEIDVPHIFQLVRVKSYSGPEDENQLIYQEHQNKGSILHQMTMGGVSRSNNASQDHKVVLQCLSQTGELLIYKIDLASKQIQLIKKLSFQHATDASLTENVVDHQIHEGSKAYTIALTDQGNIHIYHIFSDETFGYRGTIQVARGSQKIVLERTGLYLSVLQPSNQLLSYQMCQVDQQKRLLRNQQATLLNRVEIYELGTGLLKFDLPLNFVCSDMNWSPDGKYFTACSRQDRQFRVFQVDRTSQENIWTVIDCMKHNKNFWNNYPISLNQDKTIENEKQRTSQQEQYQNLQTRQIEKEMKELTISKENEQLLATLKRTQAPLFKQTLESNKLVFAPQHQRLKQSFEAEPQQQLDTLLSQKNHPNLQTISELDGNTIEEERREQPHASKTSIRSPPSIDGEVKNLSFEKIIKEQELKEQDQELEKGAIFDHEQYLSPLQLEQVKNSASSNASKKKNIVFKSQVGGILKDRLSNSERASQKSQHSVDFADQADQEVQEIFNKDAEQEKPQSAQYKVAEQKQPTPLLLSPVQEDELVKDEPVYDPDNKPLQEKSVAFQDIDVPEVTSSNDKAQPDPNNIDDPEDLDPVE